MIDGPRDLCHDPAKNAVDIERDLQLAPARLVEMKQMRMNCSYAPFSRSSWIFVGCVVSSTACSPACTPPVAGPAESNRAPAGAPEVVSDKRAGSRQQEQGTYSKAGQAEHAPSGQALSQAPGVDLSQLTDMQRLSFFQIVNSEPSACGKPHSLVKSLNDDPTCKDSRIIGQFIADRLQSGASVSDIKAAASVAADSLRVRKINTAGRPVFGVETAPVTVVVFADFECPHCAAEAPKLRKAITSYRGKAKLVYRHFPLSAHPRAKVAAEASEVAFKQGKFWEFHDKVFANQGALEDVDLLRYAKEIGLDMEAFRTGFNQQLGKTAVEKDRTDGEKLEIMGTPAVFVNGRFYNEALFGGMIEGWIDDALRR